MRNKKPFIPLTFKECCAKIALEISKEHPVDLVPLSFEEYLDGYGDRMRLVEKVAKLYAKEKAKIRI